MKYMNEDALDNLYKLAELGSISKDQLDAVALQLANSDASTNSSRIIDMLRILGETTDPSYAQVVGAIPSIR